MVPSFQTPGIYTEEIPHLPPQVIQADTTQTAFIGYTEKASQHETDDLLFKPHVVRSMLEFEAAFGGPCLVGGARLIVRSDGLNADGLEASLTPFEPPAFILYNAMRLFFNNGGQQCVIVSTGHYQAAVPELQALLQGLMAIEQTPGIALVVIPEACTLLLSDYQTLSAATLQQCATCGDRFAVMDMHGGSIRLDQASSDIVQAVAQFRVDGSPNQHLRYGAVYAPYLITSFTQPVDTRTAQVSLPGSTETILLDTLAQSQPAIHAACLRALDTTRLVLPPSGAVAGVYVSTDLQRGVWKAPANVTLNGITATCISINNPTQEMMNIDNVQGKSVNAIRAFSGKGIMVWGARTLAGNDNEWRYIPVQRFALMLETSVKLALQSMVFEPNDTNTWAQVTAMLENFLTLCWRQGALQGSKPEHAFYVAVGLGVTMTAQDITEGNMRIEIGFAASRPAEFIVLRICQAMA